ncbi:hypothetical protein GNI_118010, partial [Gregarina niphandrodes]
AVPIQVDPSQNGSKHVRSDQTGASQTGVRQAASSSSGPGRSQAKVEPQSPSVQSEASEEPPYLGLDPTLYVPNCLVPFWEARAEREFEELGIQARTLQATWTAAEVASDAKAYIGSTRYKLVHGMRIRCCKYRSRPESLPQSEGAMDRLLAVFPACTDFVSMSEWLVAHARSLEHTSCYTTDAKLIQQREILTLYELSRRLTGIRKCEACLRAWISAASEAKRDRKNARRLTRQLETIRRESLSDTPASTVGIKDGPGVSWRQFEVSLREEVNNWIHVNKFKWIRTPQKDLYSEAIELRIELARRFQIQPGKKDAAGEEEDKRLILAFFEKLVTIKNLESSKCWDEFMAGCRASLIKAPLQEGFAMFCDQVDIFQKNPPPTDLVSGFFSRKMCMEPGIPFPMPHIRKKAPQCTWPSAYIKIPVNDKEYQFTIREGIPLPTLDDLEEWRRVAKYRDDKFMATMEKVDLELSEARLCKLYEKSVQVIKRGFHDDFPPPPANAAWAGYGDDVPGYPMSPPKYQRQLDDTKDQSFFWPECWRPVPAKQPDTVKGTEKVENECTWADQMRKDLNYDPVHDPIFPDEPCRTQVRLGEKHRQITEALSLETLPDNSREFPTEPPCTGAAYPDELPQVAPQTPPAGAIIGGLRSYERIPNFVNLDISDINLSDEDIFANLRDLPKTALINALMKKHGEIRRIQGELASRMCPLADMAEHVVASVQVTGERVCRNLQDAVFRLQRGCSKKELLAEQSLHRQN